MKIRFLESNQSSAWDSAVHLLPEGTFCHLSSWRQIIEAQFGFKPMHIFAEDNTGIVGLLPLFHVKRWPFPNALISSPVCVYGGSVASSDDIHRQLGERAIEIGRELGVRYVELRDQGYQREGWCLNNLYYTFRKPLPKGDEDTLLAIPNKQRAEVRKGIKAGLEFTTYPDVAEFYSVYSRSVRNLGSPGFTLDYYQSLIDGFGSQAEVAAATLDGQPISAVINFYYKDQVLMYYGGGLPEARTLRSTQYLYWQVMQNARDRGAEFFDFGRSMADSGTFNFKRYWKFEPEPLHYHYYPITGKTPDINPQKPVFALASRAWSKLPLTIAQKLGPTVARAIV